ncbi:MAG: hypothetical protein JNK45_33600 [Myxococcales bacterium]|nr:hypothetical protein [Myxococcales bacterium]
MGTVASDKEGEREASESSGYTDLMEIANALGIEDDDAPTRDEDGGVIDDLEPIGAGYGGAAAAALISDASLEAPANAPKVDAPTIRREPPPPPAGKISSTAIPAAAAEPPPPPADAPKAAASVAAPVVAAAPKASASVPLPVVAAAPKAAASTVAPVVAAPRPAPQPEPEQRKGGLMWMAVAGVVVLGGAFWFMNRDSGKQPVAQNEVRAATPAPDPDAEAREAAAREAKAAADKAAADKAAADAAAAAAAEAAAAEAARLEAERLAAEEAARLEAERLKAEAEATVTVTQKKKGDKKPAGDEPAAEPKSEPKPEPLTPGEIDEKFRAECVLNPNKPGCDEIRKKARNQTDLDATLSDKLTQPQIREGFSSVKKAAKACGGAPGVTVRVKVSINGNSGNVISAEALDDHAGTPLGNCVADALKGASFPRFTSEQQGTVYPVSF